MRVKGWKSFLMFAVLVAVVIAIIYRVPQVRAVVVGN